MRYLDFREKFKNFLVFSLNDIRKVDPSFHRQRLNEWQTKGYIKKIINEYYIFTGSEISEPDLFIIANKIYRPSYVSLESALSYYNLIPEGVYSVTSVTSKTTRNFSSKIAPFSYRKVKPELLFGYRIINYRGQGFKIAEIDKALLDYFYLNPLLKSEEDFREIRINPETFKEQSSFTRIKNYLRLFGNKSLERRINKFLKFIKDA